MLLPLPLQLPTLSTNNLTLTRPKLPMPSSTVVSRNLQALTTFPYSMMILALVIFAKTPKTFLSCGSISMMKSPAKRLQPLKLCNQWSSLTIISWALPTVLKLEKPSKLLRSPTPTFSKKPQLLLTLPAMRMALRPCHSVSPHLTSSPRLILTCHRQEASRPQLLCH